MLLEKYVGRRKKNVQTTLYRFPLSFFDLEEIAPIDVAFNVTKTPYCSRLLDCYFHPVHYYVATRRQSSDSVAGNVDRKIFLSTGSLTL